MLPELSSTFPFLLDMRSISHKIFPLILAFLISLTSFGCVSTRYPPSSVLKDALALQMDLTEQSLDKVVELEEGLIEVVSVKPSSINYVQSQEGKVLSISGRCDCKFPGLKEKNDIPFQLFLEQGSKGESWRLARPNTSRGVIREWTTYPLPIKN